MTQPFGGILTSQSQTAKNPHTEFFKGVVRDSGIKLMQNDDPNILTQEQALVVRDIENILDSEQDEDVQKFLKGFKILIKKEKYLRKALLPSLLKKHSGDNGSDIEVQQESLFRIFLKVSKLQKQIIEIILDELTSVVTDDENDVAKLRLLLSQLRCLPHIKNPEGLTKLLDIIDIASYPSQLEILDSIPEIFPDSEYHDAAKELMNMLDKNDDLSAAVIDCLNALTLSSEIRTQIQDHILAKILIGISMKIFPIFLDFLLSDCNSRSLPGILFKIRNAVNAIMAQDKTDKEKESSKVVIFNKLQRTAISKVISEGWLSVISNIKSHVDHRPVDLIVLFMLHSSTKLKKRTIELTFRKKIKDGQLKCSLLEQLFEKYFPEQLIRDYFSSIVEVGSNLLRSSDDPILTDFASTLFKLLFKSVESTFRQEILENMILLVGSSDQKNITVVLTILLDLLEEISKTPSHALILMHLLEKLQSFDLNDVRLVFEILCRLTCNEESLLTLKEELHMLIRKYLTSTKRTLKLRGIISAVIMAKHVATTTEENSELVFSEDSILTINQLNGVANEAASILELASTSAMRNPELLGLYYDQLGSMLVKCDHLDRSLMVWLNDTITQDFQSIYVVETISEGFNDLEFSMQYNLNSEDEVSIPLTVNIAELTLKPEKNSILVLAPHFRLLRTLHFKQQHGDLSSIDALLGCGVVLPKFEQRDSLGIEQTKQMTDCIFHCINWFRETISGFVSQNSPQLRKKVLQRIDNLHELEKLLLECLEVVPNHKLPHSYFDSSESSKINKTLSPIKEPTKVRAPKKKLKSKSIVEDTTVAPSTSTAKTSKKTKEECREFRFREIDTDVVKLLMYPLESEDSNEITLNLIQLNFLLRDYIKKLNTMTKKRDLGLSRLNVITPLEMMMDCEKVLRHLNKHFEDVLKRLDDVEEEDSELRTSFGLVLETLSIIFTWPGFQHTKSLDLLRNILKAFRSENSSTPLNSVNHLTVELIDRLSSYTDYCSLLTQAVDMVKTLEALYILSPSTSIRSKIAKTSGKLLNKKWEIQTSTNIEILIKSYLSSASIKTICGMVASLQDEVPTLTTKTDCLQMLKSVTKSNFYVFYRNLLTSLHERVKTEVQALTNAQHLTLWRTTALTMQGLMSIAKEQDTKFNLVCFLKKSVGILKIFLSHGIPILEIELKSEPDRVVEIFKTIQSSTRFLHHLCCYSKLNKDASLMAYVPQFRLVLETLVYRVKAALVANGCSAAFWMGNLKNRDLQGEDILSQSTTTTVEEPEDEEMPSDEELEEANDDHSGSEVFG